MHIDNNNFTSLTPPILTMPPGISAPPLSAFNNMGGPETVDNINTNGLGVSNGESTELSIGNWKHLRIFTAANNALTGII